MKRHFLMLVLSFVVAIIANGQEYWYWQNPIPQGNELHDIWLFDEQSAIAVGDVGTVIKTDDGGLNWIVKHYVGGITGDLKAVFFISQTIGWAGGTEGKILKTTDGGENWSAQTIDNVSAINGIFFHNSQNGWAVGNRVHLNHEIGVILKTTDGGTSWTVEENPNAKRLNGIQFFNTNVGWAMGSKSAQNPEDLILRTEDGGTTWVPYSSLNTRELFCACFVDSLHGWAVGEGVSSTGIIVYSEDSGINWVEQIELPSDALWSISFKGLNLGWAVGQQGTLLRTEDGGQSWEIPDIQVSKNLKAVQFTDSQIVMAVGNAGIIIKSDNDGSIWQEMSSGTTMWHFYSVDFTDPDTGWVVGPNKTIIKTVNGGTSWTPQVSPSFEILWDIFMVDNLTGWAVGEWGMILHTTDGGENWIEQASGTKDFLHSCFFLNDQIGWACGGPNSGDSSMVLYTSNGGVNWTRQNCPANASLRDIYFVDGLNGWAVGDNNNVVHTTDGGLTWAHVSVGRSEDFYSIFFITNDIGWIGGSSILVTTDGGKTWTEQLTFTKRVEVRDIYFIDFMIGWAVIKNETGALFKTLDGGSNWTRLDIGTVNNLYKISIINDEMGWVVGTSSTILKTDAIVVPVELVSFDADWINGRVELTWTTATESNNYGFEIQRKSNNDNSWQKIGFVKGHGTTMQMNYYSFTDNPLGGGKYNYRLKQIDIDGNFEYSSIREVTVPSKFALYQNHPNPFNPETTISFDLPVSTHVMLDIYNMLGQKIATLVNERRAVGSQQIIWNGMDNSGRIVTSGVYIYHIKTDGFEATKKLVLLR